MSRCLKYRTRIEQLPPDLIWPEWFSGHGPRTIANRRRPMAAYRYNLLEHIGAVSSFTVRVDRPSFPKCYESMADVWSLAKAERFQVMLVTTMGPTCFVALLMASIQPACMNDVPCCCGLI